MDAFFGNATARGPRPRTRPGADAILRLELDLHETAFGVEAPISVDTAVVCQTCSGAGTAAGTHPTTCDTCGGRGEIQSVQRTFLGQVVSARPCPACQGYGTIIPHPCANCGGDGRIRARRNLTVKIPAGVEDGMRIRLAQQGEVGPGGGPAGDLYVEIHERPHDVFSRKGDDLHCRVTVPMTAAALGTRITIKTLDSRGDRRRASPAPSRARRCASAARACRTCAAPAGATCTCTSTCGRRPSSPPTRSGCCATSPGPAARRSPSCHASRAASSPACATPSTARLEPTYRDRANQAVQ